MRPIFQTTCLVRSVGSAFGTQIANPFLGQDIHEFNLTNTTVSASIGDQGPPNVQFAYLIMSALDNTMCIACMTMCVWARIRNKRELEEVSDETNELIPDNSSVDCEPRLVVPRCILSTLIFLLFIAYGGIIVMFFLLYTYVYEYLGWSSDAGTSLITMSCVVRFVFGVIVVVASRWVSPTCISIINLIIYFASSGLMLLGSLGWGDVYTVVGVMAISTTMCNMRATTITMVEETIPVTAPFMALFNSTIGWSLMILGPVAGTLLHKTGATSLPLMLLACSLTAALLFLIYSILTRVKFTGYKHVPPDDSSNDSSDE